MITKSDYLKYKECPSLFWFWKNNPTVLTPEKIDPFIDRLKSQGYEVELFARKLYPNAQLVTGKPQAIATSTSELIAKGTKELFQASFMADGLFASCDILVWNELFQGWDIIEVKSSTDKGSGQSKRPEHILDAAFQRIVMQKAGHKVVNVYLIELNKAFYKNGEIKPKEILNTTEVTTECIDLESQILVEIKDAEKLLQGPDPLSCSCKYKGRSRHCRVFDYLHPTVPQYSIYDLRAIGGSKKTLEALVDGNHLEIHDIPETIKLNDKHKKQMQVAVTKEVIFEKDNIVKQFDNLEYPLYFLDYETLAFGIPKYDKTFPYQQTVFQYSLHIMQEDGTIEHKEFIHRDASTPVHIVAEKLKEEIGDRGNVVVWNKGFECTCNKDLALVNPDLSSFLLELNERTYDLMDIFRKMEYLHHDFKAKYSIKNILPVMCPELSYEGMEVSNGTEAVVEYENLIFGNVPEELKEEKFDALLEYCKLDTWAMVRIFQELQKMINL